jgi:hypothetical protein
MNKLELLIRRHGLTGSTVVKFQCDGCMGSDHKLKWIGVVTGFFVQQPPAQPLTMARVLIIKRDDHRDNRDHDLGVETLCIEDSALQCLSRGLYFYYK